MSTHYIGILRCKEELLATTWLAGVGLALSWVLGTVPWEVHVPTYPTQLQLL